MNVHKLEFDQKRLHCGAVLGTVAHAVWIAQEPTMAALQSWNGANYLLNDMSGTIGTVTFGANELVAAFFDGKLERTQIALADPDFTGSRFHGMSAEMLDFAKEETLQFMLQNVQERCEPVVTAALWSVRGDLVAVEPWNAILENGGHIIRIQLLDEKSALAAWQTEYALSDKQARLVQSIYARCFVHSELGTLLSDDEAHFLSSGTGIVECRELLAAIGVTFPV